MDGLASVVACWLCRVVGGRRCSEIGRLTGSDGSCWMLVLTFAAAPFDVARGWALMVVVAGLGVRWARFCSRRSRRAHESR